MYDAVVFYNHFGAGDLFESREFVKDIMNIIPADLYFYAHAKSPKMFMDIPNLRYSHIDDRMPGNRAYSLVDDSREKVLFINTWIGHNSKYVLPGVGCVLDKNYEMFNDTLRKLGYKLSFQENAYLPQVDYSFFHTSIIDQFITEYSNTKKVLVCNGQVQSMQAENFDFVLPIRVLAAENPDILFLVTDVSAYGAVDLFRSENVIPTYQVIKALEWPDTFDLNEIAYLARFMDVIIGRKSGPFVFAHDKDVWYDGSKRSLSFTYQEHSSHFVRGNHLPLKKFWSPATQPKDVIQAMEGVIIG